MAKEIETTLKLQLEAGKANPLPSSLRSSLKPSGFNISASDLKVFCSGVSATGKLPFSRPLSHGAGSII